MQISEQQLGAIIKRVLDELQRDSISTAKQTLYVVAASDFDERYLTFLNSFPCRSKFELCAVIPREWMSSERAARIQSCIPKGRVLTDSAEEMGHANPDWIVFPVVPRDIVIKSALGIADSFETKWIRLGLEHGSRIIFSKDGLEKFTGKEPKAYVAQILEYYRKVLEYEIQIKDVVEIEKILDRTGKAEQPVGILEREITNVRNQSEQFCEMMLPIPEKKRSEAGNFSSQEIRSRKIITNTNISEYIFQNEIQMFPGDIMTDMAKDRAEKMEIRIQYMK
ncbi:MAG: hypothetical protein PHN80_02730 [Hespellia sp.]|nr:hypothetical protein [Hespellia sp.]